MVIARSSWSLFAPDAVEVSCAEACLVCADSFKMEFILLDSCLELTVVSALAEISDVIDECFKVYTDVNN